MSRKEARQPGLVQAAMAGKITSAEGAHAPADQPPAVPAPQGPLSGRRGPGAGPRPPRSARRRPYLYVLLDIFSRYVVGWLLARREPAALAKVLITESCARQRIDGPRSAWMMSRLGSMTSQPVALLLATLGVVPSHSRPKVSDDNPFSEAHFKTLKYPPDFPTRFGSYEDAEAFCQRFFPWSRYVGNSITHMISDLCVMIADHPHKYNAAHRHGALGLMTPTTSKGSHDASSLRARLDGPPAAPALRLSARRGVSSPPTSARQANPRGPPAGARRR
jgi:transposase InsO family protein